MNRKELLQKCKEIEKECANNILDLRKQYAIEHDPVKIGDIVTDHYHTIKVEKKFFKIEFTTALLMMGYQGVELTKKGTPKKIQPYPKNPVYQKCIKTINGEPYKYDVEG